jgi:phage gp36-like protein
VATYATRNDIATKYGERFLVSISDRNRDGQSDDVSINRALDDAEELINSFLGAEYDLPLSPVPPVLRNCCVDMAVYQLCITHDKLTDEKTKRNEQCLAWLALIAEGTIVLGVDDEPASSTPVSHETETRVMGRDNLAGLI